MSWGYAAVRCKATAGFLKPSDVLAGFRKLQKCQETWKGFDAPHRASKTFPNHTRLLKPSEIILGFKVKLVKVLKNFPRRDKKEKKSSNRTLFEGIKDQMVKSKSSMNKVHLIK